MLAREILKSWDIPKEIINDLDNILLFDQYFVYEYDKNNSKTPYITLIDEDFEKSIYIKKYSDHIYINEQKDSEASNKDTIYNNEYKIMFDKEKIININSKFTLLCYKNNQIMLAKAARDNNKFTYTSLHEIKSKKIPVIKKTDEEILGSLCLDDKINAENQEVYLTLLSKIIFFSSINKQQSFNKNKKIVKQP